MLEYPTVTHSLANTLTELGPFPASQGPLPAGSEADPPHGTGGVRLHPAASCGQDLPNKQGPVFPVSAAAP